MPSDVSIVQIDRAFAGAKAEDKHIDEQVHRKYNACSKPGELGQTRQINYS